MTTIMKIDLSGEKETAYVCESCEEVHMEGDIDTDDHAYECGNCGTTFLRSETDNYNHQCPECKKFGAKYADIPCPQCHEEMEEVEGWMTEDGQYFIIAA